jgi:hypothetical protein
MLKYEKTDTFKVALGTIVRLVPVVPVVTFCYKLFQSSNCSSCSEVIHA